MGTSGTVLVTGAGGRLGRLLRLSWPSTVYGLFLTWTARIGGGDTLTWHIGHSLPPVIPAGSVVLHLAATLRGDSALLARNAIEAAAVCAAARAAGAAQVLIASTAAVYAPGPGDLAESDLPAPANPYGAAKRAAEQAAVRVLAGSATGLTLLRIGNVAGADALLGGEGPVVLDPVPGQAGGPHRSYIGPQVLAGVLADLIGLHAGGQTLPQIVNVAQPGVIAMGDLLTAAGRDWHFGPPRDAVVPRVVLATDRLASLVPLPPATASGIVADLQGLKGRWP